MSNKMTAEICFAHPDDLRSALPALTDNGLEIKRLNWTDPGGGPHVWIFADSLTELDQDRFLNWVCNIVDSHGGYVVEAGLGVSNKETNQ